jgi:anti-anti-sigma factor
LRPSLSAFLEPQVTMTTSFDSSARIDAAQDSGTLILRVAGELDLAARDLIESAVLAAILTAYTVILDLTDLTFCDSSGLTMSVTAKERAGAECTALKLSFVDLGTRGVTRRRHWGNHARHASRSQPTMPHGALSRESAGKSRRRFARAHRG